MERIKRKQNTGTQQQQQHYSMKSVAQDLDPAEREALESGSRKRKAPVGDSMQDYKAKNLQQKKVAAGAGPKKDQDDDEDIKAMRAIIQGQQQRRQRAPQRRIVDEDSDMSDDDDDEDVDSDELFGEDDESI